MARVLDILLEMCYAISIGSLALFNLYYFFVILPELKKLGKSSFLRAFIVWGQDIADLMEYEEIAKSSEMRRRLRTYKRIGLVFILSLPVTLIAFLLKVVITKII